MTSLIDTLYPVPDLRRTPLSLLMWWESRRLFYNRVVGATGLFTVFGMFVVSPQRVHLFEPMTLVVVLVYGVLANACYSLGWLTELMARWTWGDQAPDMGPLLFRQGLIFSVGLTLFPLGLTVLYAMLRTIVGILT